MNDINTIYQAEQNALMPKENEKLSDNQELWSQYYYPPYTNDELFTTTLEEIQGIKLICICEDYNEENNGILMETTDTSTITCGINKQAAVLPKIICISSDESVATVALSNGKCVITAVGAGTAIITIKTIGDALSWTVYVEEKQM